MPKSKGKYKSVLVIRTTAMGDVAMTVPVIEQFVKQNPGVRTVVMTTEKFMPFFRYSENVEVISCQLHGKHSGLKGLWRLFKELTSQYDIDCVIDLQVKLYSRILQLFFSFKGIPVFTLDKGKKDKKRITRSKGKKRVQLEKMVNRYADVFVNAGFSLDFEENPYPRRKEPLPAKYSFLEGRRLIGFSPLASFEGKQLHPENVRSITELLIERFPEHRILIFGGGRYERMLGDSLESFYKDSVYSTIGKMNVSMEMDLMSNLDIMISMDSSAQHICALLGVPVLTVWGATQPYTGFLGYSLKEENVLSLNLECSPCSVYGDRPCRMGDRPCMKGITAEMVTDKVASLISLS